MEEIYVDEKERFKQEFGSCVALILKYYHTKDGQEKDILGYIINSFLHSLKYDIEKLSFLEFYKKYLKGTLFLDANDFTSSQVKEIISEAKMSDRDKRLATMYFIEMKPEEEIASELLIDRKTVRNNIPKISMILKDTCSKLYK